MSYSERSNPRLQHLVLTRIAPTKVIHDRTWHNRPWAGRRAERLLYQLHG